MSEDAKAETSRSDTPDPEDKAQDRQKEADSPMETLNQDAPRSAPGEAQGSRGRRVATGLFLGLALGVLAPAILLEQAFRTEVGWWIGLVSVGLGLAGGLVYGLGGGDN